MAYGASATAAAPARPVALLRPTMRQTGAGAARGAGRAARQWRSPGSKSFAAATACSTATPASRLAALRWCRRVRRHRDGQEFGGRLDTGKTPRPHQGPSRADPRALTGSRPPIRRSTRSGRSPRRPADDGIGRRRHRRLRARSRRLAPAHRSRPDAAPLHVAGAVGVMMAHVSGATPTTARRSTGPATLASPSSSPTSPADVRKTTPPAVLTCARMARRSRHPARCAHEACYRAHSSGWSPACSIFPNSTKPPPASVPPGSASGSAGRCSPRRRSTAHRPPVRARGDGGGTAGCTSALAKRASSRTRSSPQCSAPRNPPSSRAGTRAELSSRAHGAVRPRPPMTPLPGLGCNDRLAADRQPRRDRLPHHPTRAGDGHPHGGGLLDRRQGIARARRRSGPQRPSPAAESYLRATRSLPRRSRRRGSHPPRLGFCPRTRSSPRQ